MAYPFGSTLKPGSAPTVMGTPTAELDAYFDRPVDPANVGRDDIEVNLLTREESVELTNILLDEPIIRMLGGIVLDDGNTSNHHVYLTVAPFTGQILFWLHDDVPYLVFSSLPQFLAAVDSAKQQDRWLSDLHMRPLPTLPDQAALVAFIHAMIDADTEDNLRIACSFIDCLDLVDIGLLTRLVDHPYYFFAEAVASAIRTRPDPALRPFAQQCSVHKIHQVRWAGDGALQALDALG